MKKDLKQYLILQKKQTNPDKLRSDLSYMTWLMLALLGIILDNLLHTVWGVLLAIPWIVWLVLTVSEIGNANKGKSIKQIILEKTNKNAPPKEN